MAVPKGKQRITITVSDESVEKLSYYGEKMGMNRSALCAYFCPSFGVEHIQQKEIRLTPSPQVSHGHDRSGYPGSWNDR